MYCALFRSTGTGTIWYAATEMGTAAEFCMNALSRTAAPPAEFNCTTKSVHSFRAAPKSIGSSDKRGKLGELISALRIRWAAKCPDWDSCGGHPAHSRQS